MSKKPLTKEEAAAKLVEILSEDQVNELLGNVPAKTGVLWQPNAKEIEREASHFREVLRIGKFESALDFAVAYQAMLMVAAAYGPRDKATRETLALMVSILKEARISLHEFQKTEFVDRLKAGWATIQESVFGQMTEGQRKAAFKAIQEKLREKHLPYQIMEIGE